MSYRLIGAAMILIGAGGFGFLLAAFHRKEERTLRELIAILDFMECELHFHLTPLPQLCRHAASQCHGIICQVLIQLAIELEDQVAPDVDQCMKITLSKIKDIPTLAHEALNRLGTTLGRFDLEGQLEGFSSVRAECRRILEAFTKDQTVRLRSYQTLGLCAGAALVILFI